MTARITRVIWCIPGVAEGEAATLRAAEAAMRTERARVGQVAGYVVVCRADDTRERRSA